VFSHSEFHFSVSHSGPLHVTVIAPFPVGVDAEKTEENSERVAERYFDDEEKKLPFARVWTGKEAVVKLTGEGLSALRRVRVREGKAELDGKTYLLSYRETEGYTVAIATEGREKNGRKAISEE